MDTASPTPGLDIGFHEHQTSKDIHVGQLLQTDNPETQKHPHFMELTEQTEGQEPGGEFLFSRACSPGREQIWKLQLVTLNCASEYCISAID